MISCGLIKATDDINVVMGSGGSNYNGLQVQVLRRYAQRFQFGLAYTWHKTLDYANDDSSDVLLPAPLQGVQLRPGGSRPDAHLHGQLHLGRARSEASAWAIL
jgi:hypothetical protein